MAIIVIWEYRFYGEIIRHGHIVFL